MSLVVRADSPAPSLRRRTDSLLKDVKNDTRCRTPLPVRSQKPLDIPYKGCAFDTSAENLPRRREKSTWRCLKGAKVCVIAESLNFEHLSSLDFDATMLTPSGLVTSLRDPEMFYYAYVVSQKLVDVDMSRNALDLVAEALDHILVELGIAVLDRISGPHFTFIDPRYHNNSKEIVKRARTLVALFEKEGIDRSKIVITISSTEAGVWATRILSAKYGIQVNLILVSDMVHATICAEAGAAYLTFNLSSFLRAFADRGDLRPALERIQATIAYIKIRGLDTKIIVRDLKEVTDVQHFPGVHCICLNSDHANRVRDPAAPSFKSFPQSSSSLPPNAYTIAAHAQHPTNIFKPRDEGGSGGRFLNYIPSSCRSMISMIQTPAHRDMEEAMSKLYEVIRDDVIKYRILTSRLATPEHGLNAIRTMAYVRLTNLIEEKEDLFAAYKQWSMSLTGRITESEVKVNFVPTDTDEKGNKLERVQRREHFKLDGSYDVLVVHVPLRFMKRKTTNPEKAPQDRSSSPVKAKK